MLEHLRAVLHPQPPDLTGHDDYDPAAQRADGFGAAKAAVLLPILVRQEPMVLFTRRTDTLARHSGQVSFPGGRRDRKSVV